MRTLAIFGPAATSSHLEPFLQPGVEVSDAASLDGAGAMIVFGGDGTVHGQLGRLAFSQLPLLVVPGGSGNDFARALQLRSESDALAAWKKFLAAAGNVRDLDLGTLRFAPEEAGNSRSETTYFCCVAGVGLDAEANRRANAMPRWLRSRGGYLLAALAAIASFRPQNMEITRTADTCATEPSWMVAVANAPAYGAGMHIAPRAQLDDGLLDVCRIRQASRLRLLRCLHRVYTGSHLAMPEVAYFQTGNLRLQTEAPLDVYADGELAGRTPVEVGVAPRALRVIVP